MTTHMCQTVKFFQCAENISFNSKNLRRRNSIANNFARILTLNTALTPRSPLQPYSTSPSPRPSLALFLLLLHQAIHTKIRATRIVLKLLHSGQKQNLQAFFENCAGNAANWSENLRRNWSIKEVCADGKRARNFCAGNAFHAQTKLYSLAYVFR